jgi:hypothetical protein
LFTNPALFSFLFFILLSFNTFSLEKLFLLQSGVNKPAKPEQCPKKNKEEIKRENARRVEFLVPTI